MLLQQNFPPLLVNYKINIINIFYKFENEWGNRFQDFLINTLMKNKILAHKKWDLLI